mmetsp:Transcript_52492/g.139774  ORF Transcript_52492/g.139774 Transcript_52492/m.139774 type:complete len:243 (-) Transcript_52492:237-965(-)
MSVALWPGVFVLTEKSMGKASSNRPNDVGTSNVTFGSWLRNAERRNLNPELDTSRSVHRRMAAFCSLVMSTVLTESLCANPHMRSISAFCLTLTTMSTSGTATPNAVRREISALAKPTTSASGSTERSVRCTKCANSCTALSPWGFGEIWRRSSDTCMSHSSLTKVGGATGIELGFRVSVFGRAQFREVSHLGFFADFIHASQVWTDSTRELSCLSGFSPREVENVRHEEILDLLVAASTRA